MSRLFVRAVLVRDGKFLAVTLASCGVAAIVAMFQFSGYTSFLRASAVAPRMLGGDFWVTSASVECFDFPYQFSQDYQDALSRYVPGANFRRVVVGFAIWRSQLGRRGNVAVVGVDGTGLPDNGFAADRSDLERLDLSSQQSEAPQFASISETTLHLAQTVDSLPTFLGAPYVIVPFDRARELLGMDPNSTSFLVGNFVGGRQDLIAARALTARNFPEVSMLSAADFADSSAWYWQRKTGAGSPSC